MDWYTFFETLDMAYYAHTFAVHLMQSSQQVGDQFKLDIAQRTEAFVDKEGVNIETALVYRTQTQGQRQTAKETFATRQQVDWHLAVLLVEVGHAQVQCAGFAVESIALAQLAEVGVGAFNKVAQHKAL